MSLPLVVAGLVLELVDTDLGALGVLEHLAGHRDLGQRRGIRGDGGAVDNQRDRQRHLRTGLGVELLDLDHVSDGDLVLLAAGLDDCVGRHRCSCLNVFRARASCLRVVGLGPLSPAKV